MVFIGLRGIDIEEAVSKSNEEIKNRERAIDDLLTKIQGEIDHKMDTTVSTQNLDTEGEN